MFKVTSISLMVVLLFAGLLSLAPAASAQTIMVNGHTVTVDSDNNDNSSSSTSGTNYTGSMTFTGQLYTRGGVAIDPSKITEGTYYTAAGSPVYYINGWYYYPIATSLTTVNGMGADGSATGSGSGTTGSGTTMITPGAPNTGSTGGTGTTYLTPGAPNTGAGGLSGTMWFALVTSALVALGGLTYVTRRAV